MPTRVAGELATISIAQWLGHGAPPGEASAERSLAAVGPSAAVLCGRVVHVEPDARFQIGRAHV